jgi:1,4-dihydroxy-2-naphthoate octaprenyltransferase
VSGVAQSISPLSAWKIAIRPRTLPVAFAPVLVGSAIALSDGFARPGTAVAALVGALLLQIVSNLANDVFDFERGADTQKRIGPPRAAQLGLLTPLQLRRGVALAVAGSIGVGVYLVSVGGWPIAALGVAAIVAAIAYTGGPFPFGYKGLGDPVVFFFFGIAAVVGTHWVQTLQPSVLALAASLPVGSLATAILVVNNTRDIETDRVAGKRTIAVRIGRTGSRVEYALLMLVPYASLPFFYLGGWASPVVLLPLATLPTAAKLIRVVARETEGEPLNYALAGTARLAFFFSLLFAIGLAWP